MKQVTLFTTFNESGYHEYGKNMLASFSDSLPDDVQLRCYYDGFEPQKRAHIEWTNLNTANPHLKDFKRKFSQFDKARGVIKAPSGKTGYNYNFDAIKFCHKVFCITHALRDIKTHYAFWIDGDTICKKPIPQGFFQSFLSQGEYICYLGRTQMYSECGFIGFDLTNPCNEHFTQIYEDIFNTGDIFVLPAWHDCVAFDEVRKLFEQRGYIVSNNISQKLHNCMHPFVNTILGEYMDHLKGPRRKKEGSSFEDDYLKKTAQ